MTTAAYVPTPEVTREPWMSAEDVRECERMLARLEDAQTSGQRRHSDGNHFGRVVPKRSGFMAGRSINRG